MRLSSIVRLYRVRLRARLVQELFAVLGIAIGVALLFSSQVANTSLNGSVQRLTNGIVGRMRFQITARDSHGFDGQLLQRVGVLPGVQAAAPVLEEHANVIGPSGQQSVDLVGTDPRLAHLGGNLVHRFGAVHLGGALVVFVLPAPVAQKIGASSLQPVTLQIGAEGFRALLVPELLGSGGGGGGGGGAEGPRPRPPRRARALVQSPIPLAPLATVQRLSGMAGRLTSVFIRSPPRLDRQVRAELERVAGATLNVRPANFSGALFSRAAGPVNQSTGLFSGLSALVGFLFAFNALLLTAPQRRNLIEDLRLDGYTRRMIVEVLLLDALVLGVLASILGLLLGELLSSVLFDSNPGYLSFAFPIGAQRIVTWWSVALSVAGGMLAACVGVLAPLRADLFRRLGGFFGSSAGSVATRARWRLSAAAICLAITTAILLAAPQAAIVGVFSLTGALLLCLPALLDLAVTVAGRLQRLRKGASSYLALIELRSRSNRPRSIAIAATGAIAVFGSVSIQGARGNLQRGLESSARGIDSPADIWVSPAGTANSFATTSFTDRSSARLAQLPGVRAVHLYRGSFLDWGDRRIWVVAPPRVDEQPIAPSQLVDANAAHATARLRGSGWIVLSQALASEHHLRVGQTFTLPSSHPQSFRVAALSTNLGWPPGAIVMNAEDYARAWGSSDPSAYQVELASGASAASVSEEVRSALGPLSGLHVETSAERQRLHYAQAAQGLSRLTQIRTLVLIAAVLAMAAAMGAMIWQRRTRLADMKVDGFSRAVLWRALLWESGLLLGAGCSIGAVFGLYGQLLLSRALAVVSGFPVSASTEAPAALGSFALITAVAVAIVAVPGYLAARVRPAVGFQE
jgi:putative ABC transport system permease protein